MQYNVIHIRLNFFFIIVKEINSQLKDFNIIVELAGEGLMNGRILFHTFMLVMLVGVNLSLLLFVHICTDTHAFIYYSCFFVCLSIYTPIDT